MNVGRPVLVDVRKAVIVQELGAVQQLPISIWRRLHPGPAPSHVDRVVEDAVRVELTWNRRP